MAMIKGTKVVLKKKNLVGIDGFDAPIYEEIDVEIENVLIAPSSTDDVTNTMNLHGKKAVYTLAIPKSDTNIWEETIVEFFGKRWKTIGNPLEGMEENIPLEWNKKVMVERYG